MFKYTKNENGVVLVIAVILVFIISLMGISYYKLGGMEGGLVHRKVNYVQALYCAEAGIDYGRYRLNAGPAQWATADWGTVTIGNIGIAQVQFIYNKASESGVISATSTVGNRQRTVNVAVSKAYSLENYLSPLNGSFTLTGGIKIDGRDHIIGADGLPELKSPGGSGAPALTIPKAMNPKAVVKKLSKSGALGGTVNNIDYAPASPKKKSKFNWDLIQQKATSYTNPHSVLGFATENDLIVEAKTNGRYIYAPKDRVTINVSHPTGITYVDFTGSGKDEWDKVTLTGEGVLVIYSQDHDGVKLKNLRKNSYFKGLLLIDGIEKINGKIMGATLIFDNDKVKGNGELLYSRDLIKKWINRTSASTDFNVTVTDWSEQ